MDISNQSAIQKRFSFRPELITGFTITFGIGNQRCHQLQNILFTMNIGEWVIVHRLFKVDGIEYLDDISMLQQSIAAFDNDTAFRECFVKINKGNISPSFASKIR